MTDIFGGAPPALANPPQFTEEYWAKVPRQQVPVSVRNVRTLDNGDKELICALANGQMLRFRRKQGEIAALITPGAQANLELIGDELITGLFLPQEKVWAFRMTAADLAEYTKEVSGALMAQRNKARELMNLQVTRAMFRALADLGLISVSDDVEPDERSEYWQMAEHLALIAIGSLESGPEGE